MSRPMIKEYEKTYCPNCSYGYVKYKTSGGNKSKKLCDVCCGHGHTVSQSPILREMTDEEWMTQLQERIEKLEGENG